MQVHHEGPVEVAQPTDNPSRRRRISETEAVHISRPGSYRITYTRITVHVATLTGNTYSIAVNNHMATVRDLKELTQECTGFPVDQQRLISDGRQMCDDHALAEYDVGDESSVTLQLKLRGC